LRSFLPFLLKNGRYLLTHSGREHLRHQGNASRRQRKNQAMLQLDGKYRFDDDLVERTSQITKVVDHINTLWPAEREYFDVCNLRACVVHEIPKQRGEGSRRVVLLHGNPSWSFMYRNIIPRLLAEGHEVFALDWIGFGLSDKPLKSDSISIELHMKTIICLFEHYDLQDAFILAHDWGGCIALCTLPQLRASSCSGILLLNSFLPPRVSDISVNCYSLYLIWFCAQGLLDGYLPESSIMRYMAPTITSQISAGYSTPFQSAISKTGVTRLAHLVPGMPSFIYRFFLSRTGILFDGICPSTTFSSLHEQAQLRQRDIEIRKFWSSGDDNLKAFVLFGRNDPLLRDYRNVLMDTIRTQKRPPKGLWLEGAGHYPVEERPDDVADIFHRFIRGDESD